MILNWLLATNRNDSVVSGGYHAIAMGMALCSMRSAERSNSLSCVLETRSYSTYKAAFLVKRQRLHWVGSYTHEDPISSQREESGSVAIQFDSKHQIYKRAQQQIYLDLHINTDICTAHQGHQ